MRLLARELALSKLSLAAVEVSWIDAAEPARPDVGDTARSLPDIRLPVAVSVPDVSVRRLRLLRSGEAEPIDIDRVEAEVAATRDSLGLERLMVAAPTGGFVVRGGIRPQGTYPVHVEGSWRALTPADRMVHGWGSISGDLDDLVVVLEAESPFGARVDARVRDAISDLGVDARVSLTGLQTSDLSPALEPLALDTEVSVRGSITALRVQGSFDVRSERWGRIRGGGTAERRGAELVLDSLEIRVPGAPGYARATGSVNLGDAAPRFDLAARWAFLQWPLRGEPVATSPRGRASIEGTTDAYTVRANGSIRGRGLPDASLSIGGRGDAVRFVVSELDAAVLGGRIRGKGEVRWSPVVGWTFGMDGDRLDIASLVPDSARWPGQLSFSAGVSGRSVSGGLEGRLDLHRLEGTLRGERLDASAAVEVQGERWRLERLVSAWGAATARAAGELDGPRITLDLELDVPDLGLAIPDASGAVRARGHLGGTRLEPVLEGTLEAEDVSVAGYAAERVSAGADVNLRPEAPVAFELDARGLQIGDRSVNRLAINSSGTRAAHMISGELRSELGDVQLELTGGLSPGSEWTGTLSRLDARTDLGDWRIARPTTIEASGLRARIDSLCLLSDPASLCTSGSWARDGGVAGRLALSGFSLSRLERYLPPEWRVEGTIALSGTADRSPGQPVGAALAVQAPEIRIGYPLRDDTGTLRVRRPRFDAVADERGLKAEANASFTDEGAREIGSIQAALSLPDFAMPGAELKSQPVSGTVAVRLDDFGILEASAPSLSDLDGTLRLQVAADGTIERPRTTGSLDLVEGRARIPELGLELTDIGLTIRGVEPDQLHIEGGARSSDGTVSITGTAGTALEMETPLRLRIEGRDFEVANTSEAQVAVSPLLDVLATRERVDVTGEIEIPRANIRLREIPEFAVRVSEDAMFVDDTAAVARGPAIHTRVRVSLGEQIEFDGFGLTARFAGTISVTDEPRSTTAASGELRIDEGQYRAYGQNLTIDRGRFLYGGGPIDNPGLDIQAFRRIQNEDVTAGLRIGGTLKAPELTLYSEPPMTESEALSYMILGRRIGDASSAEGNRLANAATSLGIRGGNLLAARIGTRFGLEEFGIQAGRTLEDASLVAGTYLSPRLYVSYGIGLFDHASTFRLRYLLSGKWTLQGETGRATGGDLFYRLERGG
jgi:translocation and assembly module TamB